MKVCKKNLRTTLIGGICAVTVLMGNVTPVLANNHSDSTYTFDFKNKQLTTDFRKKSDDSYMYMKCTSITNNRSYTAHAVANNTTSKKNYVDVSRGHTYRFTKGTTYKMVNFVNEDNYKYGAIAASPNYANSFTANGLWSPDSILKII